MFFYATGEDARVGDVITSHDKRAVVELVIDPGTPDAMTWSAPNGGMLIAEDWDGKPGLMLVVPPDREQWVDIVFIRRGKPTGAAQ